MVLELSMRDLGRRMAAHLTTAFGDALEDLVLEGINEEHPQQFTLSFTLYQYAECRFIYDQGHRAFVVQGVSTQFSLNVAPSDEELLDLNAHPQVIEGLDAAVRLRIPDQYLAAEPWNRRVHDLGRAER